MRPVEFAVIGVSFAHTLLTDSIAHPDNEIHASQFTIGSGLHIALRESRCFSMKVTGIGRIRRARDFTTSSGAPTFGPARQGSRRSPQEGPGSRSFRPPEVAAGIRRCHVLAPQGAARSSGPGSRSFGAGCANGLEGPAIGWIRWAEHGRSAVTMDGNRLDDPDRTQPPRSASPRGFLVAAATGPERAPAACAQAPARKARKRSNAAMPSSTVTRSITPSCSIFVPHFSSAAGRPRYLRAASS